MRDLAACAMQSVATFDADRLDAHQRPVGAQLGIGDILGAEETSGPPGSSQTAAFTA
jgi:hypothetical protein